MGIETFYFLLIIHILTRNYTVTIEAWTINKTDIDEKVDIGQWVREFYLLRVQGFSFNYENYKKVIG